jgi:dTMP kinase
MEWTSSALVKAATRTGIREDTLTPSRFSVLHATDFADRSLEMTIQPLKARLMVVADRYACAAFTRDVARAVDRPVRCGTS